MAYLIFADRKGELARHELTGPITIGRAPECTIVVRDVLLSRRHCKIEPMLDRWVIEDLGSKNGTQVEGRPVTRQTLEDGDVIRAGRIQICFRAGKFVPAPPGNRPADVRPVDPIEALAGTVAGFRYESEAAVDTAHFPRPQPRPAEHRTSSAAEAHSLITGLSSSSWDDLIEKGQVPAGARRQPKVSVPGQAKHRRHHTARWIALGAAVMAVLAVLMFLQMH